MRTSHVCPTCGAELGRVRAPADPVHGLPIVVCPGCKYACVRRRHPLTVRASRATRVASSLARLGLAVFAVLVLAGTTAGFIYGLRGEFWGMGSSWGDLPAHLIGPRPPAMNNWLDSGGRSDLFAWGFAAVFAGVWLRGMMPHWRGWALWAAWMVLLTLVMTLEPIGDRFNQWYVWLETGKSESRGVTLPKWADGIAGVFLTGVLVAGGMPVGGLILRLGPRYRSWQFGRMRRGIRKLRQA